MEFTRFSTMNAQSRRGFSLMEVLLATALLMGCVVVLSELANIGRQHIRKAEKTAAAELICQSALNEILIGAAPAETFERRPVEDPPGWVISLDVQPLEKRPGLAALEITVAEDLPEDKRAVEFSLKRWILDPAADTQAGAGSNNSPDNVADQPGGGG